MKNLKLACFLLIAVLPQIGFSQISPKIYGEKDDYKQMAKRTLIVELMEEDPQTIKYLSKKEKRADDLEEYKQFIVSYNAMIKTMVPKYWTYNTVIEYKTQSEVKELRKAKNTKYAVLCYFELSDSDIEFSTRSGLVVPSLYFTRIEEPLRKPDYKIYLPSSYIRTGKKYLEADLKFALIAMQANVKWMIKNDKTLNIEDFCEKMTESNCDKLVSKTILVEKSQLYEKLTEKEAAEAYGGKLEFVGEEDINTAFVNKAPGKAILLQLPYGIAKGSIGPISSSSLVFFKVVVDCETGTILWTNNPGSFPVGKNISKFVMEKDFKNMSKCKV